jgi:modulator of FtsH protease HflK
MSDSPLDPNPSKPAPAAKPEAPLAPEIREDAGSQALSDALRSSFAVIKVIMLGLVVVFLCSGLRIVGPQEKAVILRFGKPVGQGEDALLGPGAHWAFPYPIDEIVRIPVGQVQTVASTIGWYGTTAAAEAAGTEPPPGPSLNPDRDGYLLTGDENIVHARGSLRYRITEPGLRYEFELNRASNLVQNAFNNALIYAACRYKVDDALTSDVAGFRETVRTRLEQLIGLENLGATVDQIELQLIPPRQLKAKFDAVLEAQFNSSKEISDAKSFASRTLSEAKAEAGALESAGETDRKRLVEFVAAEARRFDDLLPAFRRDPDLFIRLQQTEAFRQILTNAQEKILLPNRVGGKPYELRLQLNRAPQPLQPLAPPRTEEKEDQH